MSHELDVDADGNARMFSVKEVPWHGLGRVLDAPPTVAEGITAAGLDWTVESKRLVLAGTDVEAPAYATVRSVDQAILGIVGTSYVPVQNKDAFAWFQPWLDANLVTLETAGALKGGRHVWILAKIVSDPVEIIPGDPVERFILLSNSHDGSRMVRAGFVGIRVVCNNTLTAALSAQQSRFIRVRHTKGASDDLKEVQAVMDLANKRFLATVDQMRAMTRVTVDDVQITEYVRSVFKPTTEQDIDTVTPEEKCERLVERIKNLMETGRGTNIPGVRNTVWCLYNAVTEYLTWERGRNASNRLSSLWFGDGQAVAMRAFQLAMNIVKHAPIIVAA